MAAMTDLEEARRAVDTTAKEMHEAAEERQRLFEEFRQANQNVARKTEAWLVARGKLRDAETVATGACT